MPVVNIRRDRLRSLLPGVNVEKALEILPFIGVDIEGVDENIIRVEYNPNRPDFSSDYGIIRALAGVMGKKTGMPKFRLAGKSGFKVNVDDSIKKTTRPFIVALAAMNGSLDDETIKQLIAMQEDLHNGIGRRRKKASIGLHNLDAIKFPIRYSTVAADYSFIPLGEVSKLSIDEVLQKTEQGRVYGNLLRRESEEEKGTESVASEVQVNGENLSYPVIIDSAETTISLPPIINGETTKIDERCKNLFVEVTASEAKAADDLLAVLAITLHDAGFKIKTVAISSTQSSHPRNDDNNHRSNNSLSSSPSPRRSKSRTRLIETPDIKTRQLMVDVGYVNDILGLSLDAGKIVQALEKSRLDATLKKGTREKKNSKGGSILCTIPRYRMDLIHGIDLVEEVAIGYGVYRLEPCLPASATVGQRLLLSSRLSAAREIMIGLGVLESLNFSLTSKEVQYGLCGRPDHDMIAVDATKSSEHEVLRSSLIPSLLQSLSRNIHEEYPQRLFEVGKIFQRRTDSKEIIERLHIAALIAHSEANYTEAKSAMQTLLTQGFGLSTVATRSMDDPLYIKGRCATITINEKNLGLVGEIAPFALEGFRLRVPVSAFEIDISTLLSG